MSGETLLGEPPESAPVRLDAVQADDPGGARLAPFVNVQPH